MIYFIQNNGDLLIKIGHTDRTVECRKGEGETWAGYGLTVLASMPGDESKEKELHRQFSASRINPDREWFRATPDLLLFIIQLSRRQAEVSVPPVITYDRRSHTDASLVEDFMEPEEFGRPEFLGDETPDYWIDPHTMRCRNCSSEISEIIGTESPSAGCPGAEKSVAVVVRCKEGCMHRLNFAKRDRLIHFWASHLSDEDVFMDGQTRWNETYDDIAHEIETPSHFHRQMAPPDA